MLIGLTPAAALLSAPARAQSSATATGTATATVIKPISSTVDHALDFGKWNITGGNQPSWISIDDDPSPGTITNASNAHHIAQHSNPTTNGEITVTGAPGANFTITNTILNMGPQEGTLTLICEAGGTIGADGTAIYYIGGTWNFPDNGDANDFDVNISSVVNYD